MGTILKIDRLSEGSFTCSIDGTTVDELSDAIAGLCAEERGQPFFDAIIESLVFLMSDWDAEDIDEFVSALGKTAKSLKEQLEEVESKRLNYN